MQCENCDEEFNDSDAEESERYCSRDCENDHDDRIFAFQSDSEFLLDLYLNDETVR